MTTEGTYLFILYPMSSNKEKDSAAMKIKIELRKGIVAFYNHDIVFASLECG